MGAEPPTHMALDQIKRDYNLVTRCNVDALITRFELRRGHCTLGLGSTSMKSDVHCIDLGQLSVPGMHIKVRWFPEGVNDLRVWHARSNILSFSRVFGNGISPGKVSAESSNVRPTGALMFRPRSAMWNNRMHRNQVLTVSSYFDANLTSATGDAVPAEMIIDDFSMLEMMQMLHDEVRKPGPASLELVSAIGSILRIKLFRLMSRQARAPSTGKPCRSLDVAMIHGLIGASRGHLPTTAELARRFNTSRRNLLRVFKATTGTSPSRYIEDKKIENAKTMLAASKLSMKQIAHAAGYSTASHFSARFRQLTGLTPSVFRGMARRRD
jgi:AraC-like DNA-binding protein